MASSKPRYRAGSSRPPIVGIGASAGGLAAIQELFDHLPNDTGAAFVLVQHLSPDFKSLMEEILARHTQMRIVRVESDCIMEPNSIYLLQPRADLHVDGNCLKTERRSDRKRTPSYPVDTLFDSMASQNDEPGIAIVLSGTGSDGSRGVRRMKERGGVVIVQSPKTAEFDGMPNSAIATGCVDRTLDPAEIAELVTRLVSRSLPTPSVDATTPPQAAEQPYERIIGLLAARVGYDLACYKPGTITRRIERRMAIHHIADAQSYIQLLESDKDEVRQLAKDCLIHVTYFFRDPKAFAALEKCVRDAMMGARKRHDTFRVWVPGCSTGEEAYSIASIVERTIQETGAKMDFKIFATDLDETALAVASAARYPAAALVDVPPPDQEILVQQSDEALVVRPSIRNRVVFARHDVLKDPPFPRADLISCRNLLIYLDTSAQAAAFDRFLFSLRSGGILFLGSSETAERAGDAVAAISAKHRIFRKVADTKRVLLDRTTPTIAPPRSRAATPPADQPLSRACARLVELFGDAGIVVASSGEVIHGFGDVSRWLRVPKGSMTTRLDELLPPEARATVRLAIRQARSSSDAVRAGTVPSFDGDGAAVLDAIHVCGSDGLSPVDVLLMRRLSETHTTPAVGAGLQLNDVSRNQIETLERELATTRESLQSSIEELETTNEELQSVNEELLASNEELQSTNEELHSVNEELYTVNGEHQQKIGELVDVTEDLEHLLHATQVGTIFLDKTLTIRRFTASALIALPLRNEDVGRSLHDLKTHLVDADLAALVRSVIDGGEPEERRCTTAEGTPVLVSVHPYRRDSTGGAVLTFVDVRRLEESGEHQSESARLLRAIGDTSEEVIRVADAETLKPIYVSKAFDQVWGRPAISCVEGSFSWTEAIHADDRDRVEQEFFERAPDGKLESEYRIVRPDASERWIHERAYYADPDANGRAIVVSIARDVTARVAASRKRRRESEMHRVACARSRVPMLILDIDGNVKWHNDAANRKFGNGKPPQQFYDLFVEDEHRSAWRQLAHALCDGAKQAGGMEARLSLGSGGSKPFQIDTATATPGEEQQRLLVCHLTDLSEHVSRTAQLAAQAEELEAKALTDALTGLLNRRGADREVERVLRVDRRREETTMALLVDCDDFKSINDDFGYDGGDAALKAIADRMQQTLRPDDVIARVGGDEFLAVLAATRLAEGAHVADKLRRAIHDNSIRHGNKNLQATVSVGVIPIEGDVHTVEQILAAASETLHRSKSLGKNRVSYASEKHGNLPAVEKALDDLIERGRLRVVRQSLNSTESGEVIGYELLSRGPEPWVQPAALFDLFRRHDRLGDIDLKCLAACLAKLNQQDERATKRRKKGVGLAGRRR